MKKYILSALVFFFFKVLTFSQTNTIYSISFNNATHHEATIEVVFTNLEDKVLELRMSRTSPGRYALHEFIKNVYNLKAFDADGNKLKVTRPNPYQWNIANHNGFAKVTYTLFANRGGGTYSQIDETHAHLNIPATFVYAKDYEHRPINITFNVREDLGWKVATQLRHLEGNSYYAPDLDYFMDSPTEISNYALRSFKVNENGKEKIIKFVIHHNGTDDELDEYFDGVKKVVLQQKAVYGELPDFDFNEYTFLACYIPNVSGDGMEHRNSTILTSTRSLANDGIKKNMGTVSHEFFHTWNVERIRPQALEPFNYEEANMSGELWFAEGFTSYYTNLILCRAGLLSQEDYIIGLAGGLNYVWNSPARNYFNPVEMSYQAPFVDAAHSVDPVNRENTFISYYTYGSVLGLALDLSLRNLSGNKNLDDFMKLVWNVYGKTEIPYTIKDLQVLLGEYAGIEFAANFFNNYVFDSKMPDYKALFATVGVSFEQPMQNDASLGATLSKRFKLVTNPFQGSAAYKAGLDSNDQIISINNITITSDVKLFAFLKQFKPGQSVKVVFTHFGKQRETQLTFDANNSYVTSLVEKIKKADKQRRDKWLGKK